MDTTSKPRLRGVSHQFAFFVALGAGLVLVGMSASARVAGASAVYAVTLAMMLGVSAAYHRGAWRPAVERIWRRLDHSAIFLVIAGTYTPICVIGVGGATGMRMLLIVWAGAALGILQATLWSHAPRAIAVALYISLGWVGAAYFPEVRAALGTAPLVLIFVGGLLYTAGALVYALKRPDPIPTTFGYHEIFHACVIAAAVCHFAAMTQLVRGA
jgi:hemolysin III